MFIWRKIFKNVLLFILFVIFLIWQTILHSDDCSLNTVLVVISETKLIDMTQQDSIFTHHIFEKSYTLWRFWSDILRCHRRLWKGTHPIIITVRILLNVQFDINYRSVLQEMKKSHQLSSLLCLILFQPYKTLNFAF